MTSRFIYAIIPALIAQLQLFSGCKTSVARESMPFTVHLTYSGGMMPDSREIYMSADSSVFRSRVRGVETEKKFTLQSAELDALRSRFEANEFCGMKAGGDRQVYDRGGYVLTTTSGSVKCQVNDSGKSFIEQQYAAKFKALVKAVEDLAASKTK